MAILPVYNETINQAPITMEIPDPLAEPTANRVWQALSTGGLIYGDYTSTTSASKFTFTTNYYGISGPGVTPNQGSGGGEVLFEGPLVEAWAQRFVGVRADEYGDVIYTFICDSVFSGAYQAVTVEVVNGTATIVASNYDVGDDHVNVGVLEMGDNICGTINDNSVWYYLTTELELKRADLSGYTFTSVATLPFTRDLVVATSEGIISRSASELFLHVGASEEAIEFTNTDGTFGLFGRVLASNDYLYFPATHPISGDDVFLRTPHDLSTFDVLTFDNAIMATFYTYTTYGSVPGGLLAPA